MNRRVLIALTVAAGVLPALPQAALAMNDPATGRWVSRDPLVYSTPSRGDAGTARALFGDPKADERGMRGGGAAGRAVFAPDSGCERVSRIPGDSSAAGILRSNAPLRRTTSSHNPDTVIRRSPAIGAGPHLASPGTGGPGLYVALDSAPTSTADPLGLWTWGDACNWLGVCIDCGIGGAFHQNDWFSMRCTLEVYPSPHWTPPTGLHYDLIGPAVMADPDCCCVYLIPEKVVLHLILDVIPAVCSRILDFERK